MPKTNVQQQIFIDALPEKVWTVLTSPHYVKQYLFDGNIHCQWKEGQPILLEQRRKEATEKIAKGSVVRVVPGVLLKYKLEEETGVLNSLSYELIPTQEGIELRFCSEGPAANSEHHLFHVKQITLLLQKIKWLAEYA